MDETQPLLPTNYDAAQELQPDGISDLVEFDIKGDPDDPLNWPERYRWGFVFMLACMSFTVTFTCTGIVPVAGQIIREIEGRDDKSASVLFVTIWELGEATGPLLIAPLSELYGRYLVFNVANVLFILGVTLTMLSQSTEVLILSRCLTGCAVASNVLNPAIVGDIFPADKRGSGMSVVVLGLLLGGAVGPVIAGAIAQTGDWRRILWMSIILAGVCELAFLTLFRETYKARILRCRAARLRKETGNQALRTVFDVEGESAASALWSSIQRPITVLFSSFVLQAMSLWGAFLFAFFYIMSTTLPDMLHDIYNFTPPLIGSSFLIFSFGSLLGNLTCNFLIDRIYIKVQVKQERKSYPEGRLPLLTVAAFGLPLIVAIYGIVPDQHWPVWLLLLAVMLLGFVFSLGMITLMTYIVDAFGLYSASAMTAILITRCLMGTFLPLVTAPLTETLGYGLGFLVLAAASLALAPIPVLVLRYGSYWRRWSTYTDSD